MTENWNTTMAMKLSESEDNTEETGVLDFAECYEIFSCIGHYHHPIPSLFCNFKNLLLCNQILVKYRSIPSNREARDCMDSHWSILYSYVPQPRFIGPVPRIKMKDQRSLINGQKMADLWCWAWLCLVEPALSVQQPKYKLNCKKSRQLTKWRLWLQVAKKPANQWRRSRWWQSWWAMVERTWWEVEGRFHQRIRHKELREGSTRFPAGQLLEKIQGWCPASLPRTWGGSASSLGLALNSSIAVASWSGNEITTKFILCKGKKRFCCSGKFCISMCRWKSDSNGHIASTIRSLIHPVSKCL